MEPALDVVNRALQGDLGARSFLERTTSLYVLDVTDASNPKTYGCWNFIHQAMNEIERYETRELSGQGNHGSLSYHVRMVASMALKVARRGPTADKSLIITCTSNASQFNGSVDQSQWLVDLNLELREIVMGRIAAMVFDFSFHLRKRLNERSAFSDHVALDTFCAVLSANAVSSGPKAVGTFATEWIIPSSKSLPTFSVVSVVLHLASEGIRKAAPAGTKDVLQQLSFPIMSIVLVPILADSLAMNVDANGSPLRDENSQIAATSLIAMKSWCNATDLSLPLIKHICSKVNINVVELLSDAMYSDSTQVVDALAEFVESTAIVSDEKVSSSGRLSQVRHIIQPDVASFQTQVTGQQLKVIESREMLAIVDDLMSAIGLQRFRFIDRQAKGSFDVCRNLARIASSICDSWVDTINHSNTVESCSPEGGALAVLLKGANHPSVNICAICLKPLARLMPLVSSLPLELLPILQRRAIIPHHLRGGKIDLDALDLCGVAINDFHNFRLTVLSDALLACWAKNDEHYMDSCTAAIEEFCGTTSSIDVSLQTEAALFCIEQMFWDVTDESQETYPANKVMGRLVKALLIKPPSVMSNALTRETMCRLVRKYVGWFATHRELDVAMDLILASFHAALLPATNFCQITEIYEDTTSSCVHETSLAFQEVLRCDPIAVYDSNKLASLLGLWEGLYNSSEVHTDDRIVVGSAIARVVSSLSDDVRMQMYDGIIKLPIERLECWLQGAQRLSTHGHHLQTMEKIGDEISVVAILIHSLAFRNAADSLQADYKIPEEILSVIRKVWPNAEITASNWGDNENIARGLTTFLSELLPPICDHENNLQLITELCKLAVLMLQIPRPSSKHNFDTVVSFMRKLLATYGNALGRTSDSSMKAPLYDKDIENIVKAMIWKIIDAEEGYLGLVWTCPIKIREQGNGQSAFESKSVPIQKSPLKKSNMESLSGVLLFLTQGLVSCPAFMMRIPAIPPTENGSTFDHDENRELLIRRAAGSASMSLDEHHDTDIVRTAVAFLVALIRYSHGTKGKQHNGSCDDMQWTTYLYSEVICKLMIGICGKYEYNVLQDVTELLVLLLQSINTAMNNGTKLSWMEMELYIFSPIRQQYDQIFLFGDHARQVTQRVLFQYLTLAATSGTTYDEETSAISSLSDAVLFIQDVWQLHQIDDPTTLPGSDGVHQFISKYSNY